MWPYRDWVVSAFNADMPLDQFTVEQLAGDLLPSPTEQQLIATAFHRNTMSNDEGGTDDEEFRVAAVKDRVDTTIQVWMGLTMGCAKCHSHKYDPLSQQDYYRFYAIFNQTEDADRYDDAPRMEILTASQRQQRDALHSRLTALQTRLKNAEQAAAKATQEQETLWTAASFVEAKSRGGATLAATDEQAIAVSGNSETEDVYTVTLTLKPGRHTALRLEALPAKLADGQPGVGRNPADPNFVVSELEVAALDEDLSHPVKLTAPRADFAQEGWPVSAAIDGNSKTGWAVSPRFRERRVAIFTFAEPLTCKVESKLRVTITQEYGNRLTLAHFRLSTTTVDPASLTLPDDSPEVRTVRGELAEAQKALQSFDTEVAQLPVLRELPGDKQRVTTIHRRGNFLDPGDEVSPHVPATLHSLPEGATLDDALTAVAGHLPADRPLPPSCLVAVSGTHVGTLGSHPARQLADGDELVLIAPVAGG